MAEIMLEALEREEKGSNKLKHLRRSGLIPGVIYGAGHDNIYLKFNEHDLLHLFHGHTPENLIIELKIAGKDKKEIVRNVLIREVQRNPISGKFLHVDFMEISMTQKIKVNVPLEIIGEAVGVTEQGGIIEHLLREAEFECLPKDLPELIEVDVTDLKIGESLTLKDIALPKGLDLISDGESPVAAVSAPRVEEEVEEVPEEEEMQEPEVIGREKEEPEEEKE